MGETFLREPLKYHFYKPAKYYPFCGGITILAEKKFAFVEQRIKLPPASRNTGNYSFRVMARGKANLLFRLRGPKNRYYGNIAAKVDFKEWQSIAGSIQCAEKSYLVLTIRINGNIDLDSLRLVMTEEMKEEMPDSSKH